MSTLHRFAEAELIHRITNADRGDRYFLSPHTMSWFDSRIMAVVWTGPDTAYFVLRDKPFDDLPGRYQVHVATFWVDEEDKRCVRVDNIEGHHPTAEAALLVLYRAVAPLAPQEES